MAERYYCDAMRGAIVDWGGVWWDEEKCTWFIEDWRGDEAYVREIQSCIWCGKDMPIAESTEL